MEAYQQYSVRIVFLGKNNNVGECRMKLKYDVLFVVLVYNNLDDIRNLIPKVKKIGPSHRIIIVESYYDNDCSKKLRTIALENECDFIQVENKGYGAGNNRGIEYALNNYDFNYLVVCNADIDIIRFPQVMPEVFSGKLIAPIINTITGKSQNPFWVKENKIAELLMYTGFKLSSTIISGVGFALYKLQRIVFLKKFKRASCNNKIIMGAHGAFVMYSRDIFDKIGLPYDENMFLFAEECLLAHVLKSAEIKTIMTKDIQILHYEDGSMNTANIRQREERRKSIIYYYEKWYRK